ncbi:hypothetical protein [Sphingomonas faeni]|uniref:hypothetical protein n=1 Tax=Sphingomonas faeni TaxID=185950 RepID=UPI003356C8D6
MIFMIGEEVVRNIAEENGCTQSRIEETLMKAKYNPADDLQLVALMISKLLKTDHGMDTAPVPADYRLVDTKSHANVGQELRVGIRIDRAVTVDVDHIWWGEDATDLTTLTNIAFQMADTIGRMHAQRITIIEMLADVNAAARKEVAKGRRRGIPYRLASVTPTPSGSDHGEVCMEVLVETLGENLRPQLSRFEAHNGVDATEVFEAWNDEQSSRARLAGALDEVGATGQIDAVIVNALLAAGHDMIGVLSKLAIEADRIVDIGGGPQEEGSFQLYWKEGQVFGWLKLADGGSWNEGRLYFQNSPIVLKGVEGKRVSDVLSNPVFGDNVRVTSASGDKGKIGTLSCTPDMLNFDAETGRLWAD